jgi:hypothetical protein
MADEARAAEVSAMPGKDEQRPPRDIENGPYPWRRHLSLEELAVIQGVRSFDSYDSFEDYLAEYRKHNPFSSDEEIDEFIAYTRAARDASLAMSRNLDLD